MAKFKLKANYKPTGDQPQAIKKLVSSINRQNKHQTLVGVTGSGKTFTMANIIEKIQKPTLVIAHNKTLAAQLYQELRDFFPHNAVSYFVSYYDYYQPEAYIPTTDTYIEKEAQINDEIDKLRLAATTNLLTRKDVIIVASVSCIYNLGNPVEYGRYLLEIIEGEHISRKTLLLQLANMQYSRSSAELRRGTYRLRGDIIQLWPAYSDFAINIDTLEHQITSLEPIDPISGEIIRSEKLPFILNKKPRKMVIYPAKHYMINPKTQHDSLQEIQNDLNKRINNLEKQGMKLEAYRLKQRVQYDVEMIREYGFVNGIENYTRYFDGRKQGEPPFTLIDYFKENQKINQSDYFLTIIDESHITLPQIKGMYRGDRSRKQTLIKYGFRLPSALDNRPLTQPEFMEKSQMLLYVSATPAEFEIQQSKKNIAKQLIRPTGLLDPSIEFRYIENQIQDLVIEIINRIKIGQRILVTTLTKKMAEALTEYLNNDKKIIKLIRSYQEKNISNSSSIDLKTQINLINKHKIGKIDSQLISHAHINTQVTDYNQIKMPKVAYLHSDIDTLDRSDILDDLRTGKYDVVVGINLLREGLDLPEVSLVAILDADKEGFLRSTTTLIQTMGRAARHEQGHAILYADNLTKSMKKAVLETLKRRSYQKHYNLEHNITPSTIAKPIRKKLIKREKKGYSERQNKQHKQNHTLYVQLNKKERIDLNKLNPNAMTPQDIKKYISQLTRRMKKAARDYDFELAAILRDKIKEIKSYE